MNDDMLGAKLRAALHAQAEQITPGEGLDGIHGRLEDSDTPVSGPARRRWPWVAGIAAAAAVGVIGGTTIAVNSVNNGVDPIAQPGVTSSATSAPPTASPPSTPATTATEPSQQPPALAEDLPVYWLGDSNARTWLYREFRDNTDLGNAPASSVMAMTQLQPNNPGTYSPWQPASSVQVSRDGDALTVDISADAFGASDVSAEQAKAAVQSVVYTATAAAQSPGPVTILIDGAPGNAWGVDVGQPMRRDSDLRAPIWVLSPDHGATVSGTPRVSGVANVYEGTVMVEALNSAGAVVDEGFGTAAQGEFAEYAVDLDLPPGTYTVRVFSPDVSGGEAPGGPRLFEVTRRITVR